MDKRKLRFAIFGNIFQTKKSASIQKMLACLSMREAEIYVEAQFYRFLINEQKISVPADGTFEDACFEADFVVSMGGDGTFLRAASMVRDKQIPIIGVNMGRLGFLADISAEEIEHCVDSLYTGDYSVEQRAVITVETDGEPFCEYNCALNDVAVLKRDNASMITIRTKINDDFLTTYQADGVIISTPTGSTAYSLSNGGPIIVPGTNVMLITAVAPHSLNVRPIVIPDNATVALTVESRSHNFLVAFDGRSENCKEGTTLLLRRAPYSVKVVKRAGQKYFHTLREKMMWGADVR